MCCKGILELSCRSCYISEKIRGRGSALSLERSVGSGAACLPKKMVDGEQPFYRGSFITELGSRNFVRRTLFAESLLDEQCPRSEIQIRNNLLRDSD